MILKILKNFLGFESKKDILKEIRNNVNGKDLSEGLGEALESGGRSLNLISILFKDGALEDAKSIFKNTMESMKVDGGHAFTELTNSSTNFFSTLASGLTVFGQLAIAAGAIAAVVTVVDLLTVSYDEAREKMDEVSSSYKETANEVKSLESELETTRERIKELEKIQANGNLSLVEDEELDRLKQQNELLNRQLEIEEKLANIKAQEQAESTKEVLDYKSEEIYDYNENGTIREHKDGTFVKKQVNRFDYLDEQLRLYDQARNNVEKAKESLIKAKEDYGNGIIDEETYKQFETNLKNNEKAVVDYEKTISSTLDGLGSDISNLYDINGNVIAGYEDYVNRYNEINNEFNNIDLSYAKKEYKEISKFFSSTTGKIIKKSLEDASDSTENLEDKLNSMGLTIDDIGADSIEILKNYFDDTKSSVSDAKDAVEDFKVSVSDVEAAFESKNRGADYETMVSRLKEADELYKNGLIGTDEFQKTTQWLLPNKVSTDGYDNDAIAYKEAWEKAYNKVKGWFNEDKPVKSMWNFLDDLYGANSKLFTDYNKTKGRVEFSEEFTSTAQAAEELEVSIDAVETMFKRLEDYGFQFGDDFKYSGEMLDDFKSGLDGVSDVLDTLNDGAAKDRLSKLVENWEKDYDKFNSGLTEDLNKLSKEQIIKIKFEYDLATIQSEIDKIRSLIEGGADTSENHAAVIAGNEQYINRAEEGTGFDVKDVKIPVEYTASENAIDELKAKINEATSEEDKIKIQAEVENLQELQKSLLNAFSDVNPEINAESSTEETQKAWDEFVDSVEGQNIIANLNAETDEAEKTIDEILYNVQHKKMEIGVGLSKKKVEEELDELGEGSTIEFTADIDNVERQITATKNQDGTITYTADINGEPTEVELNKDGTINYVVNVEDNASEVLKGLNETEIKDKFVSLYAEDKATGLIELWNIMEAEDKFSELSAEDKASLVLCAYNALDAEDKNSLISQTGGEVTKGVAEEVNRAISLIPEQKNVTIGAKLADSFNTIVNNVKTTLRNLANTSIPVGNKQVYTGTMLSPAHADGTAYNVINTRPISAYANGNVSLPKDEKALVNELGTESIIRDGKWMLIPGGMHMESLKKGDIIINAEQTKDLIEHGKTKGHARAYASGTLGATTLSNAYANTGYLPTAANNYIYNKTSSSTSSNKSNNNKSNNNNKDEAEKIDWIVRAIQALEREISNLDKIASATYINWSDRNTALGTEIDKITNQISVQEKAYNRYLKEANSVNLSSDYKNKVQNGTIDIQSIKDENLREKISEYQEYWDLAQDAYDKMQDLQSDRASKAIEQFELIATQFENELSLIEHETSTIENMIDSIEARGYMVASSMYNELAKSQEKELGKLKAELDALNKGMETALAEGRIDMYSEDWYSMYSQILDVESAIQDVNSALIDTANNAREADWALFDKTQELIGELQEESDWIIDLMSSKDMFNDDASISDEGMATLGLHAVNYNAYMSQANDYAKELKKINEELAKEENKNNTTLLDRRKELLDTYRDMISSAEDEKEAIKDIVSEGFDMYMEAMNKLIDKRKEWLSTTKDLFDYEKNVADQVSEIAKLEKQLSVYSGDTSEESRAKIQQTEEALKEARESLEETEYDRYIQDQEQMLDKLADDTQEWIDERLDDINGLLQGVIDAVNNDSTIIKETLESLLGDVGAELSDDLSDVFSPDEGQDVTSTYDENFDNKDTTVNEVIKNITDFADTLDDVPKKNEEDSKEESTPTDSTPTDTSDNKKEETKETTDTNNSQSSNTIKVGGKINAKGAKIYDYAGDKSGATQYYKNDPIYTVLAEKNGYLKVRHHKAKSGVTGWFKKNDVKAYKTGGLVDETGLAWLDGTKNKPELVLNAQDTSNFVELKDVLRQLSDSDMLAFKDSLSMMNLLADGIGNMTNANQFIPGMRPSQNITVEIGDIQMSGVNDPATFAIQLKDALLNNKTISNIIQADTLGAMMGKNSLNKFKY